MIARKDAYAVLGLSEGASRNEIEKKYEILFKKYKAAGSRSEDKKAMDEIIEAYNVLMGYSVELPDETAVKPNPLLDKMGIDRKKAGNFFYYYKFHIAGGILLLIFVISLCKSLFFQEPVDLKVAFVGEFYYADSELLANNIKSAVGGLQGVSIDGAQFAPDMGYEMESAMRNKKLVLMVGENIDIFIVDRANFVDFASQGMFVSLDELAENWNVDREANATNILQAEDDEKEHLYGISVKDNALLKDSGVMGKEAIAAIGVKSQYRMNAEKLMEVLYK